MTVVTVVESVQGQDLKGAEKWMEGSRDVSDKVGDGGAMRMWLFGTLEQRTAPLYNLYSNINLKYSATYNTLVHASSL